MTSVAPQNVTEMEDLQNPASDDSEQQQEKMSETKSEPAVLKVNEGEIQEESPPLTYIDFLPQCLGSQLEGSDPTYAEFQLSQGGVTAFGTIHIIYTTPAKQLLDQLHNPMRYVKPRVHTGYFRVSTTHRTLTWIMGSLTSVVEQANQWLRSMPQFSAVKCETVDHKVNPTDFSLDPDLTLQHFSSHGKNVYLRGLRVWLMPKMDDTIPTQQLAYITVLPDHSSGSAVTVLSKVKVSSLRINPEQLFNDFDETPVTFDKLNHHLQQKPLPGRILSVETVHMKAMETDRTDTLDTEATFWTENGKCGRLFLYAIRIFYVVGQPAFETIGYYDEVPNCIQNPEGLGLRVKFAPFTQTVAHATKWLSGQRNMRAVNFQSLTLKLERPGGSGIFRVNPSSAGFTETQVLQESRYVKILRIFYAKDQKSDSPALYSSVSLSTRIFVPSKGYGRSFETFSKTMQRVITWLNATGTPVLAMETVKYPVNPDSENGVNRERVDCVVNSQSGHYDLTCVRLFFPCEFKEPPPELVPGTEEDAWGWGCVVS